MEKYMKWAPALKGKAFCFSTKRSAVRVLL